MGSTYSMDTLDKGMIHVPGGVEGVELHKISLCCSDRLQFKMCIDYFCNFQISISGVHVTESKAMGQRVVIV